MTPEEWEAVRQIAPWNDEGDMILTYAGEGWYFIVDRIVHIRSVKDERSFVLHFGFHGRLFEQQDDGSYEHTETTDAYGYAEWLVDERGNVMWNDMTDFEVQI